jgi:hypothetical protein
MRNLLVILSAFLVFALIYFLGFYSIAHEPKTNKILANSLIFDNSEFLHHKLSMKQIDSLTAVENYKFTIENYYRDVLPIKSILSRTNNI